MCKKVGDGALKERVYVGQLTLPARQKCVYGFIGAPKICEGHGKRELASKGDRESKCVKIVLKWWRERDGSQGPLDMNSRADEE